MEVYESEREQIDAIKKWWKENGKAVTVGLLLGLACLVGWQQWQAYMKSQRETGSTEYELMMRDLSSNNTEQARQRGNHIVADYQNTPYAALAALVLAKIYVGDNDYPAAHAQLQFAEEHGDSSIKAVARLRQARLMLAQKNPSGALALLNSADASGFEPIYDEVKGDAYAAMGNADSARSAYSRALEASKGVDTSVLSMKLDELGGPESL